MDSVTGLLWSGLLKSVSIGRLEGAILNEPAEISQISDAPGPDGVVNLFLYLVK